MEAVAQFAEQESQQVRAYQREAATLLPFKQESTSPKGRVGRNTQLLPSECFGL